MSLRNHGHDLVGLTVAAHFVSLTWQTWYPPQCQCWLIMLLQQVDVDSSQSAVCQTSCWACCVWCGTRWDRQATTVCCLAFQVKVRPKRFHQVFALEQSWAAAATHAPRVYSMKAESTGTAASLNPHSHHVHVTNVRLYWQIEDKVSFVIATAGTAVLQSVCVNVCVAWLNTSRSSYRPLILISGSLLSLECCTG